MRDNKRLLIALSIALLLCLCLLAAVLFFSGKDAEQPAEEEAEFVVVRYTPTEDITSFTLFGTENKSTFSYTDSGWVYNGLTDFPLNADFMHSALETLSMIDAVEVVAEGVNDLSPYGLDRPQMSFTFTAGEEYSYLIGDYNSYSGYYYLCEEGEDTVFLVDADLPLLCGCEESELITLGALPDNFLNGTVKRVSAGGSDYTEQAFLDEVHGITLSDYEKYKVGEEDVADGVKVVIYYSAQSEDSYGTASYSIELIMRIEGEHLLFTYGDDGILYRLEKSDYPELAKIIE